MHYCCIRTCKSTEKGHKMHYFPRGKDDLSRYNAWIIRVGRDDLRTKSRESVFKSYRVCDMHFSQAQTFPFNRNRTNLKVTAVPDINLPPPLDPLPEENLELITENAVETPSKLEPEESEKVEEYLIIEETSMKTNLLEIDNFSKICRICLINSDTTDTTMKSIDESADGISIRFLLQNFTPVQLSPNENYLPQNVCSECIENLISMHIFSTKCQENEDLLHEIWENAQEQDSSLNVNQNYIVLHDSTKKLVNEINEKDLISNYTCEQCSAQFSTEFELICHQGMTRHQGTIKHSKEAIKHSRKAAPDLLCQYCGLLFFKNGLTRHIKVHTRKNLFKCDQCNADFFKKNRLEKHLKIHSRIKPKCEICGNEFTNMYILTKHWKTHVNENRFTYDEATKLFVCFLCKKSCQTEEDIQNHSKQHESQHDLCTYCGMKFASKSEFNVHMQTHTGEQVYTCEVCNKTFTTSKNLKLHEIVMHSREWFKCKHCQKKFRVKSRLEAHLLSHKNFFQCRQCNQVFTTLFRLSHHCRIHKRQYACKECPQKFTKHFTLEKHRRLHTSLRMSDTSNLKMYDGTEHIPMELDIAVQNIIKQDEN